MPKTGAHQALELLEQYHSQLTRPSDSELRYGIERVIGIFKSNLFQALCDIQDFLDNTLLNERVTVPQKTLETRRLAERWENNPPFGTKYPPLISGSITTPSHLRDASRESFEPHRSPISLQPYTNGISGGGGAGGTSSQHSYSYHEQSRQLTKDGWATSEQNTRILEGPGGYQRETTSSSGLVDEHGREWEVEDVVLEKNKTGLGFSISGGKDRHGDPDHYIRVTDISPGGAVARDGRIQKGDVILKVNNVECVNVEHHVAVEALKEPSSVVRLLVKRPRMHQSSSASQLFPSQPPSVPAHAMSPMSATGFPSAYAPSTPPSHLGGTIFQPSAEVLRLEQMRDVRRMELTRTPNFDGTPKGWGLSIAGGVDNRHYPNDTGIFVTRIIDQSPAYYDGRLQRGDQILAVNNAIFESVTHQHAVETLKSTGNHISILYLKNPHPDFDQVVPLDDSGSRSLQGFDVVPMPPQERRSLGGSQSHLSYGGQPTALLHQHQPVLEPGREPRVVTLRKGEVGLGFNIVGGEEREPIYVSHVLPGGVADLSGNVRKGDVLLRVNDTNLQDATHNDAALALKACPPNSYVQLLLQYRPHEYQQFEERVDRLRMDLTAKQQQQQQQAIAAAAGEAAAAMAAPRRDLYVRALFDNDPSRDAGVPPRSLTFRYGDVLHVINNADDDWWTARRVSTETGEEGPDGVIPSKKRVEKRERQRRKQVNFNAGSQSLGRNASLAGFGGSVDTSGGGGGGLEGRRGSRSQLSFSRKFPFFKSTDKLNDYTDGEVGGTTEEPVFSYETVELQDINYIRPIIMLGALKDRINDELVSRQPDRFTSCVPHTSRPPREGEVNGRDYFFVSKAEMERDVKNNLFIEAGQFQNNLYGTSIQAVREVAATGRHCLLDVSGNAIRRLQNTANIYPIAIFVKPFNYHQLREWEPQLSEEEGVKHFERCQRQEQNFGDLFTSVVTGHTLEDVLARVAHVIEAQSKTRIWVPTRQPLF